MQIFPDPFLHLNQDNSSSFLSLPLKDTFDLSSKEIIPIKETANSQTIKVPDKTELENIYRIVEIVNETLIVASLEGATVEETEQALAENKLGTMEKTEEGIPVFKFPEQQKKELESRGITSVEIRGPSGVQTYTAFNFQTLSDKELNLLITHVKTHIIFLKTKADPNDKKTEKAIQRLELKLKYLEIEKAIRTNDPRLKDLLEGIVKASHYRIAMRLADLWAHQTADREKREEEAEQKFLETKHIIILKEIFRWEFQLIIIKEAALKNEVNSHNILNSFLKQEAINKNLMNIGRFINIYNALNKVE